MKILRLIRGLFVRSVYVTRLQKRTADQDLDIRSLRANNKVLHQQVCEMEIDLKQYQHRYGIGGFINDLRKERDDAIKICGIQAVQIDLLRRQVRELAADATVRGIEAAIGGNLTRPAHGAGCKCHGE